MINRWVRTGGLPLLLLSPFYDYQFGRFFWKKITFDDMIGDVSQTAMQSDVSLFVC